MYFQNLIMKIS